MPKLSVKAGSTSQTVDIFIQDSTATDGSGKSGLVFNTAGLTAYYNFPRGASTQITLATLSTATSAYSSGGFKEIDATNQKGHYRFDIPDTLLATGNGRSCKIVFQGTGIVPCPLEIELTGWDNQLSSTGNLSLRNGTAQKGNTNSITLDSGASSVTNYYNGLLVLITSGTGVGQVRTIIAYNGTTKTATIDRSYITAPDSTSVFAILSADNPTLNNNLQVTANSNQAIVRSGTAQTGTSSTITLDTGSSTTDNIYNSDIVTITSGTGAGQTRTIIAYNGTTKVATVSSNWITTPDNTSVFNILASTTPSIFSDQGVAQSATTTTITLQTTASSTNDLYKSSLITILAGTGSGQTKEITGYVGSTKVATVNSAWSTVPDNTSSYAVIPSANTDSSSSGVNVLTINGVTPVFDANGYIYSHIGAYSSGLDPATLVLNAVASSYNTSGTIGNRINSIADPWTIALPGSYSSGQAGSILNTINTIVSSGTYGNNALLTAITNINNLSALANLFGPTVMTRPSSGSIAYPLTLIIRTIEGVPINLDSNAVTLTAKDAAGNDLSANLSTITHSGTGEYTFTYTVHSTDNDLGLAITASGTVSSSARKAYLNIDVTDAATASSLAAIQAKTDKLTFDISNNIYSTLINESVTIPDGYATTIPGRLNHMYHREFGRVLKDVLTAPHTIKMNNSGDTHTYTTQQLTDDGTGNQTLSQAT